ncbi:MAG: phosphotransferase [Actinoallomurus sp.]
MNTNAVRTPGLLEPAPEIDPGTAAAFLRTHYGLDADVRLLGSERDRTFLATTPGERRLILKVSNSADDVAEIAMENAAMRHVAETDPSLLISRVLPALDGASMVTVDAVDGRRHQVRLMTVVPGSTAEETPLPTRFPAQLGAACARMARALRGFAHPAAYRHLEWDPRAVSTLRPFAGRLRVADFRAPVEKLLDRFEGLPASTAALPGFVLHGDVTLSNVMVEASGDLTGLIDFGDMHHTARVSDLAISLASLLRVAPDRWEAAGRFLDGYQRVTPLEPDEVNWLGELVLARLVTTVLISAWRAPLHPDKEEYVTGWDAGSRRGIDLLAEPSPAELAARFHRLCGTSRVGAVQRPDPTLLERRRAGLGGALSPLFYDEPLQVVGAEGPWSTPPTDAATSTRTTTCRWSATPTRPWCRRSPGRRRS